MGSKKNFAKLMKSSLSSSKKRKLDEAEMDSADEPDYTAKDKELKALRATIAEKDAKIADLQKQLDWAMNTAALHDKMAKISDEIAEIKNVQTKLADNVVPKDELGVMLEGNTEYVDLEGRVGRLESNLPKWFEELEEKIHDLEERVAGCEETADSETREITRLAEKVEKLEKGQLDKLLGKTIKDFLEGESN